MSKDCNNHRINRVAREASDYADAVVKDTWARMGNPSHAMIDMEAIRRNAFERRYRELMGETPDA